MEHFITRAGRRLRLGYTTGSCAALAARAAVRMLLTGRRESASSLVTPKGIPLTVPIRDIVLTPEEAACSVRKDAGDDPDATDGILVRATARRDAASGIRIDGGDGVGRVTKPGLDQPVGAAAINSVPRAMIEREVREVCEEAGYSGGISLVISIPDGEAVAVRTFNANLGIVGGLSIIGTSGMVEPMSTQAVIDTVRAEMSILRSEGSDGIILTPGNYGESFLLSEPGIARRPYIKCANFIGEALDSARELGFTGALVVGHVGKLIKLSGGVMDTHSRVADCRLELLALHAAVAGAPAPLLRRLLDAATVDDGLEILGPLRDDVIGEALERADMYLKRRVGDALDTGLVLFSNRLGPLGVSRGAGTLLESWENSVG